MSTRCVQCANNYLADTENIVQIFFFQIPRNIGEKASWFYLVIPWELCSKNHMKYDCWPSLVYLEKNLSLLGNPKISEVWHPVLIN